jgi:hypothetical protein
MMTLVSACVSDSTQVIVGYREMYRSKWNSANQAVIDRIRAHPAIKVPLT